MNDSSRRQIGRIKNQLRQVQADLWSEKQEEARHRDWLELEEEEAEGDKPESEEVKRAQMICIYLNDALEEIENAISEVDHVLKKLKETDAGNGNVCE